MGAPSALARGALGRADGLLGAAVSGAVRAHHRRRLRRAGRLGALDAPAGGWAAQAAPPRDGNAFEVLIDGAEALPRIAREIAGARSRVHVAGWFLSPDFALTRGPDPVVLRTLLAEAAERVEVRVLAWAGAPLPLFRPTRRDVRAARDALCAGTRIRCALDAHERPLHCHHEKLVVIDDRVAFVGGIDLTSQAGDRFDTPRHPARAALGWHDVATRIDGPAVADVAGHFRLRWSEVTGEDLPAGPAPAPAGDVRLQIARTVPERIYAALPRGDFGIAESYVRALRGARRLVYIENQFLWSPEIGAILRAKLADPPDLAFRLLVVLPERPNDGGDDTRGVLADLIAADGGAGRVLACTVYARSGPLADRVYVHAKVCVVDDEWITVGSANLNEHSLFNDTEMNVVCRDPAVARGTRLRLWAEHLEASAADVAGDPTTLIDRRWRPLAEDGLARREAGRPLVHRLVRLPHVSRRSERLRGPLQGLVVDG